MFDYQTSIHPHLDTACRRFSLAHNLTELAEEMGITAQVLRNKLNPMQPHRLTLQELITLTDIESLKPWSNKWKQWPAFAPFIFWPVLWGRVMLMR